MVSKYIAGSSSSRLQSQSSAGNLRDITGVEGQRDGELVHSCDRVLMVNTCTWKFMFTCV